MGILVNAALGALAGVVGSLLAHTVLGSKLALPVGILAGLVGYFAGGALAPVEKKSTDNVLSEWEEEDKAKKAKKAKKAAAEARKKEEAAAAREAEAAAKKEAKKAKKAAKTPAKVESEPEESEEEEEAAPKSKSAIKKAKKAAKEAAAKKEAEAAAKKEAKKAKKNGGAAAEPAAAAPAKLTPAQEKAAAKAAAAAAAADLEGWETIAAPKPTKAQQAKAASGVQQQAAPSKKKQESIPASERLLTEDLIIPTKQHALIVGKGGETLQKLQAGSGAQIDMPKRESASAKIQITGTPAQVALAKNCIQSLVDRGFSSITHPGTLSDDITVEPTDIGLVLGANGSTLKKIIEATGAKINLPEKGSSSKKVMIVGEKDAVKSAKAALRSLIQDGFSTITHPTWIKVEVEFPADKFGILIGPKGQTIKSIQGDTKARINLPEKGGKSTLVSVCGEPAAVAKAQKQIEKLLEPPAPLPDPEEIDLADDEAGAWGQEHTAQGEDALWE